MSGQGIPFYRCFLCGKVVSVWDITGEPYGCTKCGSKRIRPTNLSIWEKLVQIWKHPKIWTWNEQNFK